MKTFKIATYNVNSIRSRLHIVIPWLRENRPDVFCMQETKVEDDKFPREELEKAGYHVSFKGGKRYNGVAVASLEEPMKVSWGLDDDPPDSDRLIMCRFSNLSVVNCYVPQGRGMDDPQFHYKLQWFERIRGYIAGHFSPDEPLICCGDMNVAREPIDVHDPKRLLGHVDFTPEVWEAFDQLKSWGLVDVFRKHHPDEPGLYAFFDYRVPKALERGLGWRVDHILVTRPLADRSLGAFIDVEPRRAEKPSDHTVMVAEFEAPRTTL
ncbi:MAG: exodeoxyribonuclease III [Deltaproteobacteria bacterium]|nr:exodeoxyribonuclease III [Deltaproteobacteria bacterium]MBN2845290.1 exodeoxyribonuclease III [Deltaproteobacteria bacterium]